MVVVGYKVQKLSSSKAALWVRFTSPLEYVGKTIQMYPKSLEPKKGPGCGADFSLLRAISASHPQATTLRDLGINSSLVGCSHQHAASTFFFYAKATGCYDCCV